MVVTPPSWYIARVEPGKEETAELLLNARGVETYLPMQTVWRRPTKFHRNKMERRTALMVGYCFIGVRDHSLWPAIRACSLVHGLLGDERGFYRLNQEVVPGLRERFGEVIHAPRVQQWMTTYREFNAGDLVSIVNGPFRQSGVVFNVEKIRGNAAIILMHLFGALTEVKVPVAYLEAA